MDILRLLFYLIWAVGAIEALTLKGGDFPCTQPDGNEIRIPGITDVPTVKIKCVCEKGVGKCRKIVDRCHDNLKGCHFVQENANQSSICAKECRPCQNNIQSGQLLTDLLADACLVQQCFSGVLTRTKVQCAMPMCPDPVDPVPGQCCPTCKGCSRAGQFFKEGETKPDVLDPCNSCTCKSGQLECVKKACPVLPCSRNLLRVPRGQCCPICSRPVEYRATPSTCLFRGKLYKTGQNVPVNGDPCTSCKCGPGPNPTVICERTTCPALMCPAQKQRLPKGQCCPQCQGGVAKALPAVWAPPSTKECEHEGRTYKDGDTWTYKCQTCTCWSNGHAHCQSTKCPIQSCPAGAKLVQKTGQCCPSCEYKDGVCTVFGDPHYRTFDGRVFNFQGSCKYLLAKDGCGQNMGPLGIGGSIPGNSTFSVRITNDARDSLAFSWTRTITVRLPEHDLKISLLQKMRVKINGKKVTLPYILLGKLSVMKDGYRVILRTNEGKLSISML